MVKKLSLKPVSRHRYSSSRKKKYFQITKSKKHLETPAATPKGGYSSQLCVPLSQQPTQIETTSCSTAHNLTATSSPTQLSPTAVSVQPSQPKITSKAEWETYYKKEDSKLFKHYGGDIFSSSKNVEATKLLQCDQLTQHAFPAQLRARMVDYIHTIISNTNKDMESFFFTCFTLDTFLSKTARVLSERDFFLISITSLYIAFKLHSLIPFHINDCIQISHMFSVEPFTEKEIKETEVEMLNTLNFECVFVSSYDFIKTYFVDFSLNNFDNISKFQMQRHISALETISVYFSKITLLQNCFYQYHQSSVAVVCIIIGYELLTSNSQRITNTTSAYLYKWVNSLIDKANDKEKIKEIYNEMKELLKSKIKMKLAEDKELFYD